MVPERDELPVRGSSLVAVAYSRIRRSILSGELPPGSHLTVRPLAESLELSPTPIRTALAALERQGLLEVHDHRGYFVPTLGRVDLLEIYEIREAVESIASRRLAQSAACGAVVIELETLLDQQRACVAGGDVDAYGELDVAFHNAIWQGSGNRRLALVSDTLLGQVRVGNNISARAPGRLKAALEEHAAIIDALKARDSELAERLTRDHVRKASIALNMLLARNEKTSID